MKKIIFYQAHLCQYGGVETMCYNWCWWLRNFFDVTFIYCTGDPERIRKMSKIIQIEKYDPNKQYECDIFIRNSVWGKPIRNVKADRMIEMRHADYKFLLSKGLLWQQYTDMGIKEIVACGEHVAKMSHEVLGDNPKPIKNILLPRKKTNKVLHLVSITRMDQFKGWSRNVQLIQMLRNAGIKFDWKIFTNATEYKSDYEELHVYKARYDIWDYLADADYTVLLTDSEGLPYTIQESLQYQVPCIVTAVGGCMELVKDGVNGYVVPLDMNFDVTKLLNIPKCPEYDNHSLEDWLDYLGYEGEINKEEIINKKEEERVMKFRVEAVKDFSLGEFNRIEELVRKDPDKDKDGWLYAGDTFICEDSLYDYLNGHNAHNIVVVKFLEEIKQEPKKVDEENVIPLDKEKLEELGKELKEHIKEEKPKKTTKSVKGSKK